ncbi:MULTISPECIES: MipA/OmpV family protein [unclassified Pseudoalteromonas]|uniref:MipA/OmpV family protein n=1 Tax=unclassified Pseudoalteromonas TaxID=194690 RepID=UPI0011084E3D|nr:MULTISPECIES: MipA/OmpV family protein [unclassified Pseudoalteromonas]TMO46270.1 MipA/OmpV family protein [Pseudoalteromonas sp. S4389]
MRVYATILVLCLWFFAASSHASNRYYADNTLEPSQGFAWDWGIGAGYYIEDSYLVGMDSYNDGFEPDIHLAISYEKFYLDYDQSQLSGGLTMGYSLIDKFEWGLDLVGTNIQSGFDETGLAFYGDDVIDELAGIRNRNYDFDVGLRLSRRFENSQISFEYLQDVSGTHNGWVMNSFYSQIIPWRNWEFRSGVGLSAYSEDFTNYYFGISESEALANRPVYRPDTSYSLIFEFHAEYPLNRHWVFLTGWLSTWFSSDIHQSPIISQQYQHKAKVGVRYVF